VKQKVACISKRGDSRQGFRGASDVSDSAECATVWSGLFVLSATPDFVLMALLGQSSDRLQLCKRASQLAVILSRIR